MIVVAHAVWGVNPDKGRLAVAKGTSAHNLVTSSPQRVPVTTSLLKDLSGNGQASVFIRFDFPIGVPLAYANRLVIKAFR